MKRNKRRLVEEFYKDTGKHEIRLVAGIDSKPSANNVIFYIRMESTDKKSGKKSKTESIWLSLDEMTKLNMLMALCQRFWQETLSKDSDYSQERIDAFVKSWKTIRESLEAL